MKKNILVIDGVLGIFNGTSHIIRKNGAVPYHLSSQLGSNMHVEVEGVDSSDISKGLEASVLHGLTKESYEKCWNYPNLLNDKIIKNFLPEAKKYNFLAIIPGNEGAVEIADELSNLLKITPVNSYEDRFVRRTKHLMQQKLKKVGIRYIPYILAQNIDEVFNFYKDECNSSNIVLKPNRSAGGIDVQICTNEIEIKQAFTKINNSVNLYNEKNDGVLVEKYIGGREFAIDCITSLGVHKPVFAQTYEKILFNGNPVYLQSELAGSEEKPEENKLLRKKVFPYLFKCLDAFGVKKGATHTEIKFFDNEPYLIETGARFAGNMHFSDFFLGSGYDPRDLLIKTYLDESSINQIEYKPKYLTSVLTLFSKETKAVKYFNLETLLTKFKSYENFLAPSTTKKLGIIIKTTSLGLNNGYVFVSTKKASLLEYKADVMKILYISIKLPHLFWSNNELTKEDLDIFNNILSDSFVVPKDFVEFI